MSRSNSVRSPAKYCSSWIAAAATASASPCGAVAAPNPIRRTARSSPSRMSGPTVLENCVEKVMPLERGGRRNRENRWLARRQVARPLVIRIGSGTRPIRPDERVEQRQDQSQDPDEHQDHADGLEVDARDVGGDRVFEDRAYGDQQYRRADSHVRQHTRRSGCPTQRNNGSGRWFYIPRRPRSWTGTKPAPAF